MAQPSSASALLEALLEHLGAFDLTAGCQALIAQHPHHFDLGLLSAPFAELEHFDVARARHAVVIDRFGFLGQRAPEHQQLANVLDRRGVQLIGQGLQHGFAGGAVIAEDTDLDESVRLEGGVGFLLDGGGQTVSANENDGIKVVRVGAVHLSLCGRELDLGHGTIIVYTAVASSPGFSMGMKVKTQSKKVNKAWLNEHVNDPYVRLAKKDGYRARAAYKLKEIDETLGLIRPGDVVVDLGSTPGAWSQYVRRRLSPDGAAVGELHGQILALDLLPMDPIEGVHFIQGDFREAEVLGELEQALLDRGVKTVDVVVSDMAPNLSGIGAADAARIEDLVGLAVDFSREHLKPDGALVAKLFHGGAYDPMVALFRKTFKVVKSFKPKASRDKSSETFLVGLGLKT
jgi:23S rRNA (uridine2552-2'-O)-methyltransferase